ncbi:argininosuccinate lyase [Hazenella coriacea]|uniref:argininosuccinate lyase n=1 Tax=Hazenella coriacea TaxID=1179467 RepID=A0A4R3L5H8_9BACL|nr:lyase family protein [Hazenella coriacea]TCS92396.1 argininosuccinate lyase [Hazenella coriacea]
MTHSFSGRIQKNPHTVLNDEVLYPQLSYEAEYLLHHYIQIEQALLMDYQCMGLMTEEEIQSVLSSFHSLNEDEIRKNAKETMTDIAFCIEKKVFDQLQQPVVNWHVDRSRNDYQACAQKMFAREQLLQVIQQCISLTKLIQQRARQHVYTQMPGYTHYQSAQVISLGFYLSAFTDQLIKEINNFIDIWDQNNLCPLGAGAMAGQELEWDRKRMAEMLGFYDAETHALVSIASRDWTLRMAAAFSNWGVSLSRFVTDFIHWGSSSYRWLDLPDELSGISSAMPQKKNFPILERVRGRTAHLTSYYMDMLLGQRNTPFSNLVEVSKEAGSHVLSMFQTIHSILALFHTFMEHVTFDEERMKKLCFEEYFGGFSLANYLTISAGVPYRKAQVIAGQYITKAIELNQSPLKCDVSLLEQVCVTHEIHVSLDSEVISQIFEREANLQSKKSRGSTHPSEVILMLEQQEHTLNQCEQKWLERRERLDQIDPTLRQALK